MAGVHIKDKERVLLTLKALPSSYKPFKTSLKLTGEVAQLRREFWIAITRSIATFFLKNESYIHQRMVGRVYTREIITSSLKQVELKYSLLGLLTAKLSGVTYIQFF